MTIAGLKKKLAITTALAAVFAGAYSRRAYADCLQVGVTDNYLCSGASGASPMVHNNTNAYTDNTFSISEASGNGIQIVGQGAQSFTDTYGSDIQVSNGLGIYIYVTGDSGPTQGSATVVSNSVLHDSGIYLHNTGHGATSIDFDGNIDMPLNYNAIGVLSQGNGVYIHVDEDASVKAYRGSAVVINNSGTGDALVVFEGYGYSKKHRGIEVANWGVYSTDLTIHTVEGSDVVTLEDNAIDTLNFGTGATYIDVEGDVSAAGGHGINARNLYHYDGLGGEIAGTATDLTVVTGKYSTITSDRDGIYAKNWGVGATSVTVSGHIYSTQDGVVAGNGGTLPDFSQLKTGTDVAVDVTASGYVYSQSGNGVSAINWGSGTTKVSVEGTVIGTQNGLVVAGFGYGGDTTITVAQGGSVSGSHYGIQAGSSHASIQATIDGAVSGDDVGIFAVASQGDLTLETGKYSSITSADMGVYVRGSQAGALSVTIDGDVSGVTGIYAHSYGDAAVEISDDGYVLATGIGINSAVSWDSGPDTPVQSVTVKGAISAQLAGIYAQSYGAALTIETGKSSSITSDNNIGIDVKSSGAASGPAGSVQMALDGIIQAKGAGLRLRQDYHYAGGDITIVTYDDSQVTSSDDRGIAVYNGATGSASITVGGDVKAQLQGVYAINGHYLSGTVYGGGTDLTVDTSKGSSVVSYASDGIAALNNGTGTLSMNILGAVTGAGNGIVAHNYAYGDNMIIATGAGSVVSTSGSDGGMFLTNEGLGYANVTIAGKVYGYSAGAGIRGLGTATDLTVATEEGSLVSATDAGGVGLIVLNGGTGATTVTVDGDVDADSTGVQVYNTAAAADLIIETGTKSAITSATGYGIAATQAGTGKMSVTLAGSLIGYSGISDNIYAGGTGDLTVKTEEGSYIKADHIGIHAGNVGAGTTHITVNGTIHASGFAAVLSYNSNAYLAPDTDLTIDTGAKSLILSYNGDGINAANTGLGALTVTVDGEISAEGAGVRVLNSSATDTTVSVSGTIYGYNAGVFARNDGGGKLTVAALKGADITGGDIGDGIVVKSSGANPFKITVASGATVAGGASAIRVTGASTGGGEIDTSGDIEAGLSGIAVYFDDMYDDVALNISGGHIVGDVISNHASSKVAGVSSTVNILGTFTSEGDFDVSDFNVAKGAVFTLGTGFTVAAEVDPIDVDGTFEMPDTSAVTGDMKVNAGGVLDIQDSATVNGALKNDGKVVIPVGGTLTIDTMQAGTGELSLGVLSAAQHAMLNITSGGADVTGQDIKVLVDANQTLAAGDLIQIAHGAAASAGTTPGGTLVHDDSFFWDFRMLGGSDVADPDDIYLQVEVSKPGGDGPSSPVAGALAMATLTMADTTMDLTSGRLSDLRQDDASGVSAGNMGAGSRVWTQALGQYIHQDGRDGTAGYSARLVGGTFGADTDKYFRNGVTGMAFSYGRTHIDGRDALKSDADVDSYQLSLYGDYNWPQGWYVAGQGAYAYNANTTVRHNAGGAGINAYGEFDAQQLAARAEFGRSYHGRGLFFTPFAVADWAYYTANGYTETGAGIADLRADEANMTQADLGLGAKLGKTLRYANGGVLQPEVHAVYRRDLTGDNISTSEAYAAGGPNFVIKGPDPARDRLTLGGQVRYFNTAGLELTAAYDAEVKEDYISHTGLLRAGLRF